MKNNNYPNKKVFDRHFHLQIIYIFIYSSWLGFKNVPTLHIEYFKWRYILNSIYWSLIKIFGLKTDCQDPFISKNNLNIKFRLIFFKIQS